MRLQFDKSGRRFFFLTFCVRGRKAVLSRVVEKTGRDGRSGYAVELTPAGEAMAALWRATHARWPFLTASNFIIMPDHLHLLLIVDYSKAREFDILDWFQHFRREGEDLVAPLIGEKASLVWEDHFWMLLVNAGRPLAAVRKYIKMNPARKMWKTLNPDRFVRRSGLKHAVLDPSLSWTAIGDLTLLASPFLFPVRLTRRMTVEQHLPEIERMVEKARREVDGAIKQAGERAVFETGVHGFHPEIIKLLGRMKFRTSYGQNALRHSIEVSMLAGVIADELGADVTMARRAGLLHDIGKAVTAEAEGSHIQLGVEIATKYRENKTIIHAIEAHHNDIDPQSVLDFIIQAADALSAARPGARREDVENYIKRLQKLEEVAGDFEGVEKTFAIQAGREVRIMVKPELIDDDKMKILARDIAKKIEDELDYPGQIKVSVIRESRTVDYAK